MPNPPAVLVTDGFQRKTYAAVRALAAAGRRVVVGESTRWAPALHSRWAWRRFLHPSPRREPEAYLDCLARVLRRHQVRVLLPMEEDTLRLVLAGRDRLPPEVAIPFAPPARLDWLRNKRNQQSLAVATGVPVPADPRDSGRFPAIVKPRFGWGGRGIRRATDASTLTRILREMAPMDRDPVVQECLPAGGENVGVNVLLDATGVLRASFAYRRLRTMPVEGGASTLRESVHAPGLVDRLVRLLRAAHWTGIAMAEFLQDPRDGEYRLIEINPRFWGSLHLACRAGVNFPDLLCRLALGEPMPAPPDYPEGVRARWLWPGDALHWLRRSGPSCRPAAGVPDSFDDFDPLDPIPAALFLFGFVPLLHHPDFRRFLPGAARRMAPAPCAR